MPYIRDFTVCIICYRTSRCPVTLWKSLMKNWTNFPSLIIIPQNSSESIFFFFLAVTYDTQFAVKYAKFFLWCLILFDVKLIVLVDPYAWLTLVLYSLVQLINSLWPDDDIWRHGTRSLLAQVMAYCLAASSHYLNQCWLIIGEFPWHSSQGIILRQCENTNQ